MKFANYVNYQKVFTIQINQPSARNVQMKKTIKGENNIMKTLQDFICGSLKDHAALVASGIPSEQALNIISQPMVTKNLNECLNQLTIDEIGKLVNLLQSGLYRFDGKKSVYTICAIIKDNSIWKVAFTDSVLQIDSFELRTEELQERMVDDILKHIKNVL